MDKHPLRSKAIWGAIFTVAGAAYGYFTGDSEGSSLVTFFGLGLMGVGIRDRL